MSYKPDDGVWQSHNGIVNLDNVLAPDEYWGEGGGEEVLAWLRENYDPAWMPPLTVAQLKGEEKYRLIGWEHEGTEFQPLLYVVFGNERGDQILSTFRQRQVETTSRGIVSIETKDVIDGSHRGG